MLLEIPDRRILGWPNVPSSRRYELLLSPSNHSARQDFANRNPGAGRGGHFRCGHWLCSTTRVSRALTMVPRGPDRRERARSDAVAAIASRFSRSIVRGLSPPSPFAHIRDSSSPNPRRRPLSYPLPVPGGKGYRTHSVISEYGACAGVAPGFQARLLNGEHPAEDAPSKPTTEYTE